jgi:hypothetical protein
VQLEFVTEAAIVRLVDAFYGKVRGDPVLGPIFDEAVGAKGWPVHLAKMYAFWSLVMLTTCHYKGNPMAAHMAVQGIEEPMVRTLARALRRDRWRTLRRGSGGRLPPQGAADRGELKARPILPSGGATQR